MENLQTPSDTSHSSATGGVEHGGPLPPSPSTPKKSNSVKILVGGILIGLFIAGFFYFAYQMGVRGQKDFDQVITPKESSKDDQTIPTDNNKTFITPTRYIYAKNGGELVLGIFGTNEEYSITEDKGVFGSAYPVSVSPHGNYLLYLRLPDEIITQYNENPPYEFHGSSDLDLHLVDLRDTINIKDTKISDKRFYGLGEKDDFYIWEKDESIAYFTESYPEKAFKIDISSKKVSEIANGIPANLNSSGILPTGEFIKSEELGPYNNSVLNLRYNLNLYSADGQFVKTLYKDFVSAHGELDVLLINDDKVAIAREVFADDGTGNSICYLEILYTLYGDITEIEKRNCPPDQSYTSYRELTVSPGGKYLVAIYPEKESSSFLIYNLETGNKKVDAAKKDSWYTDYWWVSDTEILGYIPSGRFSSTEDQVYKINVDIGSVEKEASLYGKALMEIF